MPRASSLLALGMAFFLVQLGYNSSAGAYQGFIPDTVPKEQKGTASGYMGLMTLLGTLGSFAVGALLVSPGNTSRVYTVMVSVLLGGAALTLWKVSDSPASETRIRPRIAFSSSLKPDDFRWLLM